MIRCSPRRPPSIWIASLWLFAGGVARVPDMHGESCGYVPSVFGLPFQKADQARTNSAAIEPPTRRELARTALGIIFSTMMLSLLFFLR